MLPLLRMAAVGYREAEEAEVDAFCVMLGMPMQMLWREVCNEAPLNQMCMTGKGEIDVLRG